MGLAALVIGALLLDGAAAGAPPGEQRLVKCHQIRTEANACPGLTMSLHLGDHTLDQEHLPKAWVEIRNSNFFGVELDGGQPELATFHDPQTKKKVGEYYGMIVGTGISAELSYGETIKVRILLPSGGLRGRLIKKDGGRIEIQKQETLPGGSYLVRGSFETCLPGGVQCRSITPDWERVTLSEPKSKSSVISRGVLAKGFY